MKKVNPIQLLYESLEAHVKLEREIMEMIVKENQKITEKLDIVKKIAEEMTEEKAEEKEAK